MLPPRETIAPSLTLSAASTGAVGRHVGWGRASPATERAWLAPLMPSHTAYSYGSNLWTRFLSSKSTAMTSSSHTWDEFG